jgi:hypothetical protein
MKLVTLAAVLLAGSFANVLAADPIPSASPPSNAGETPPTIAFQADGTLIAGQDLRLLEGLARDVDHAKSGKPLKVGVHVRDPRSDPLKSAAAFAFDCNLHAVSAAMSLDPSGGGGFVRFTQAFLRSINRRVLDPQHVLICLAGSNAMQFREVVSFPARGYKQDAAATSDGKTVAYLSTMLGDFSIAF